MWVKSDDAIARVLFLDEIYDNVPEEIASVKIKVFEFHLINCNSRLKKKVLNWLNSNG